MRIVYGVIHYSNRGDFNFVTGVFNLNADALRTLATTERCR